MQIKRGYLAPASNYMTLLQCSFASCSLLACQIPVWFLFHLKGKFVGCSLWGCFSYQYYWAPRRTNDNAVWVTEHADV